MNAIVTIAVGSEKTYQTIVYDLKKIIISNANEKMEITDFSDPKIFSAGIISFVGEQILMLDQRNILFIEFKPQ